MKKVSIIMPLYNGAAFVEATLRSLLTQTYRQIEVIVSDDASTDDGRALVEKMQEADNRILVVGDDKNRGTLLARKNGMAASTGDYVTFIDQDDELTPNAIETLVAYAEEHPADIYHFTAEVIPENEAARDAAEGMQSFLTPKMKSLDGTDILAFQLSQDNGFDWQLHHKMYVGDLARKAYSCAADVRLLQSDDFYLSFVITSLARKYRSVPDTPMYRYYLGRGDTFGTKTTIATVTHASENNALAYRLVKEYVESRNAPKREDWNARLEDAMRCLIDHPINEWRDSLNRAEQMEALPQLLSDWPAEYLCAELWRFSRDTAYDVWANMIAEDGVSGEALEELKAQASYYYAVAKEVEEDHQTAGSRYPRYREMRQTALGHLQRIGLIHEAEGSRSLIERAIGRVRSLLPNS